MVYQISLAGKVRFAAIAGVQSWPRPGSVYNPPGDVAWPEIRGRKTKAKGSSMADNIYSISEIVGSSTESIDDAIKRAVTRASRTLHNLDWFEVTGLRGRIEDDERCHFQVTLKVGFRLDERPT
jgi:dodecin